jgi:hypothetical protein
VAAQEYSFVIELSGPGQASNMWHALTAHALGRIRDRDLVPGLLAGLDEAIRSADPRDAGRPRLAVTASEGRLEIVVSAGTRSLWRASCLLA